VSPVSSVVRSVIERVNRVDGLLGTTGFWIAPKSLFRNILPISPYGFNILEPIQQIPHT
jgi:hypothetical protein